MPGKHSYRKHWLALSRTRLVSFGNLMDNLAVINDFLSKPYSTIIVGFCLLLSGCNKGFTLKIQDQDIFAFGSQDSCNFMTTTVLANSLRVSWKTSTPVNLIITESVPAEFDSEIIAAAAKWNTTLGKNLLTVTRDNGFKNTPGTDRVNAIYWSTEWDIEQLAQQARTAVRWDISRLIDTDIRINAKYFLFSKTADANAQGKVNLESLIVHELGHVLGLTHIPESASVMQTHLASGIIRNQPGAVDVRSMNCEY